MIVIENSFRATLLELSRRSSVRTSIGLPDMRSPLIYTFPQALSQTGVFGIAGVYRKAWDPAAIGLASSAADAGPVELVGASNFSGTAANAVASWNAIGRA